MILHGKVAQYLFAKCISQDIVEALEHNIYFECLCSLMKLFSWKCWWLSPSGSIFTVLH